VLPPLRDRGDDIDLLAQHFLRAQRGRGDGRSAGAGDLERLRHHSLAGQRTRAAERRATRVHPRPRGRWPSTLPAELGVTEAAPGLGRLTCASAPPIAEDAERRLILATLEQYDGDKKKTAAVLGVSLKTLYNRLNEYKPG
jgi:DNA-binding NtrC family response regulator